VAEKKCTPAEGKRFVKKVGNKCVSFGQKGKAKDGGDRIRAGTKKGDAYCARSLGIRKKLQRKFKTIKKDSPNELSRRKWKCKGAKSIK
jgi:hypothetical protein